MTTVWNGDGMSQEELMLKDECVLLDLEDNVVGHDNKYESHIFCPARPRAKLHRAFSVFLFDDEGRLMLQQRAASKITFPSVWTNTCCSHPLFGFSPTEVDTAADVASGKVPGVKRAAVRKLKHELGIEAEQLPVDDFRFITRLHYWAADVVTHGPDAPFGEHEIDYILLIKAKVDAKPNPEEVSDYKYVTQEELKAMMAPSSGLLWSPWFRVIAEQFLGKWWADLDKSLNTTELVETDTIHRFDCTAEHLGGAGNAGGPWLDTSSPNAAGDAWLLDVKTNGGTAPPSENMKDFLKEVGNNRWKLDLTPKASSAGGGWISSEESKDRSVELAGDTLHTATTTTTPPRTAFPTLLPLLSL
eukprot:gene4148-15763_t